MTEIYYSNVISVSKLNKNFLESLYKRSTYEFNSGVILGVLDRVELNIGVSISDIIESNIHRMLDAKSFVEIDI